MEIQIELGGGGIDRGNERVTRRIVIREVVDLIVVEMLKNEGINIVDWLLGIFSRCLEDTSCPYTKGEVKERSMQITSDLGY